jgi:hypothetical protein
MSAEELLLISLERYINRTLVNDEFGVYFIKERIGVVRNMKIEIYSNDHNPPHFHVKSNDLSINATFRLDDCSLLNGQIDSDDLKRIKAFYNNSETQQLMKTIWNKSKSENKKIS